MRVDAREVAGAPVMATAGVAPRRESVLGGEVRPNAPPARFVQHQVVMKSPMRRRPRSHSPPSRKSLESNGGRPLDENTMRTLRTNNPPPTPAVRNNNVPPARSDRHPPSRTEEVRPATPPSREVGYAEA